MKYRLDVSPVPKGVIGKWLMTYHIDADWEMDHELVASAGVIKEVKAFRLGWIAGCERYKAEVEHLERKNRHKCNDAYCPECDGPREDQ